MNFDKQLLIKLLISNESSNLKMSDRLKKQAPSLRIFDFPFVQINQSKAPDPTRPPKLSGELFLELLLVGKRRRGARRPNLKQS
jgi:hypothetical protein